jgi:hypothetical protein
VAAQVELWAQRAWAGGQPRAVESDQAALPRAGAPGNLPLVLRQQVKRLPGAPRSRHRNARLLAVWNHTWDRKCLLLLAFCQQSGVSWSASARDWGHLRRAARLAWWDTLGRLDLRLPVLVVAEMARQDDVPDNPHHIACKNGHQVQRSTHIDNTAPSGFPPSLPAPPASALVWPHNSAALSVLQPCTRNQRWLRPLRPPVYMSALLDDMRHLMPHL